MLNHGKYNYCRKFFSHMLISSVKNLYSDMLPIAEVTPIAQMIKEDLSNLNPPAMPSPIEKSMGITPQHLVGLEQVLL